jgi:hypothetical protein
MWQLLKKKFASHNKGQNRAVYYISDQDPKSEAQEAIEQAFKVLNDIEKLRKKHRNLSYK